MHETIGQKVSAMSESEIELKANRFRDVIGIGGFGPLQAVKIVEFVLPKLSDKFDFVVMEDSHLIGDFARTWPDQMLMHISDSIYDGACAGDGSCNHVIAHEIGHLVLHRNVDPSFALAKNTPKYNCIFNSEWQADTFADYLLMPIADVRVMCFSVEDIERRYRVPRVVAERCYSRAFGDNRIEFTNGRVKQERCNKVQGHDQLGFDFFAKG